MNRVKILLPQDNASTKTSSAKQSSLPTLVVEHTCMGLGLDASSAASEGAVLHDDGMVVVGRIDHLVLEGRIYNRGGGTAVLLGGGACNSISVVDREYDENVDQEFPGVEAVDTDSYPNNLHKTEVVVEEGGHCSSAPHLQTMEEFLGSMVHPCKVAFHPVLHYQNCRYHVRQPLEALLHIRHLLDYDEESSTGQAGNLRILNQVVDNRDGVCVVHGVVYRC